MLTNHFPALSVRLSAQIEVRVDYHTTTQKKNPLNFWRVKVIHKEMVQVQLDTFTIFKDATPTPKCVRKKRVLEMAGNFGAKLLEKHFNFIAFV